MENESEAAGSQDVNSSVAVIAHKGAPSIDSRVDLTLDFKNVRCASNLEKAAICSVYGNAIRADNLIYSELLFSSKIKH